jgi:hypothetical protein
VAPGLGVTLRVDIAVNDDDTGSGVTRQLVWSGTRWNDEETDGYGTLTLTDGDQDADSDGLPDAWETKYGLGVFDNGSTDVESGASGNGDGDGLTQLGEYAFHRDPTTADAEGLPEFSFPNASTMRVTFTRMKDTELEYRVESSGDLVIWADRTAELVVVGSPDPSADGEAEEVTYDLPASPAPFFVRVAVVAP